MSALGLRTTRRPARIGITPLIDVVFILMIFFMLASTFANERQLELDGRRAAGGGGDTLLLTAAPDRMLLGGRPIAAEDLRARLAAAPDRPVAVRPSGGASLQRLIDVADLARGAGAARVALAR